MKKSRPRAANISFSIDFFMVRPFFVLLFSEDQSIDAPQQNR